MQMSAIFRINGLDTCKDCFKASLFRISAFGLGPNDVRSLVVISSVDLL
jgi:Tfp pilus assembly protein PilX